MRSLIRLEGDLNKAVGANRFNFPSLFKGMRQTASVSLVYDGGYYIMFDSPSATDLEAKAQMLRGEFNLSHTRFLLVCRSHPARPRTRSGAARRQQSWSSRPFRSRQLLPERTPFLRRLRILGQQLREDGTQLGAPAVVYLGLDLMEVVQEWWRGGSAPEAHPR